MMKPLTKATAKVLQPANVPTSDYIDVELNDEGTKFKIHLYNQFKKNYRYPSWQSRQFMQRFPERQRLGESAANGETWYVGATDMSVELLEVAWPKNQIKFDNEARVMYDWLLLNRMRQGIAAENTAKFKRDKTLPEFELEMSEEFPLSPYQQLACINSIGNEGYALFMEQGTGKTPTVITRIMNEAAKIDRSDESLAKFEKIYFTLVVCPNQVRMNWQSEIAKFATRKGKVCRIYGNALDRMRRLTEGIAALEDDDEFFVVIVGYGTLSASWEALSRVPWDLAVLDESHYIKNNKTNRWKTSSKLRELAKSRMILTGSPIANTPMDLYAQWEFLGEGWSGFTSYDAFKRFFGVWESRERGIEALVGFQNLPFMQERLAKQSYIIKKAEALPDLPDKVYDIIECELTNAQADVYRQVATQLFAEIDNEIASGEGGTLMINNVLTRLLRLSQITSGHLSFDGVYDDDGNTITPPRFERFDPNPKLEALVTELKEKKPEQKTLVWTNYTTDIRTIKARLDEEFGPMYAVTYFGQTKEDDREEAVRRFNEDPSCKVFIGNPKAGGAGLNLLGYPLKKKAHELPTKVPEAVREAWPQNCTVACPNDFADLMMAVDMADEVGYDMDAVHDYINTATGGEAADVNTYCDHVIYFSKSWSAVDYLQSQDRAHRRGTRNNVRISTIIADNTIDEEIHARVQMKVDVASSISDVREVLAGVFKDWVAHEATV